jgi:predicted membrane-bound mannosyltransferase
MGRKADGVLNRFEALTGSWAAAWCILLLATVLRFWKVGEWSVWIDELSSVYFSQHPQKPFPHCFPVFFYALRALFQVAGISVPAGRLFVASLGVVSIGLTFTCLRRLVDYRVALLAVLLLAVSFGHIFWSQAIRYYMLVFVLEVLSASCFIRGLEDDNRWQLLLSNLALLLGLLTHSSAALLIPVLAA